MPLKNEKFFEGRLCIQNKSCMINVVTKIRKTMLLIFPASLQSKTHQTTIINWKDLNWLFRSSKPDILLDFYYKCTDNRYLEKEFHQEIPVCCQ